MATVDYSGILANAPDSVLGEELALQVGMGLCRNLKMRGRPHGALCPENIGYGKNGAYFLEKTAANVTFTAPELLSSGKATASGDVYSVCTVLFWMLNERRAYGSAPKHAGAALKVVILKGCANDPAKRYRDAGELLAALEALANTKAPEPNNKKYLIIAAALICSLLLVYAFRGGSKTEGPSKTTESPEVEETAELTATPETVTYIDESLLESVWAEEPVDLTLDNGKTVRCMMIEPMGVIENCGALTLRLQLDEEIAEKAQGKWGFYIRENGQWRQAGTFMLAGDETAAELSFEAPITFDAWACPCYMLGEQWEMHFSVWLENAVLTGW